LRRGCPNAGDVAIGHWHAIQASKLELRIMRDEQTDREWADRRPIVPRHRVHSGEACGASPRKMRPTQA